MHSNEKCDYCEEIDTLGGKIYHCPKYNGKNHFAYKKWWNKFFVSHPEYKVVHGHVRSTASIYLKIARKHGLYAIAHSHSTYAGGGFSGLIKRFLQVGIRNNADFFMGCSYAANAWLFGNKIANDESRCVVLKNGIDLSNYLYDTKMRNDVRSELNIKDKLVVGTVGRIDVPKNPLFIVSIIAELLKMRPDAVFLWVGDGPLMQDVKDKVNELGIKTGVIFLGSRGNCYDYLQAMDVFLFPSLWEGLGMALIEAQANGLPCVCSNVIPKEANVTDLINRVDLSWNARAWAEAIIGAPARDGHDRRDDVAKCGYDIRVVVNVLCNIYLKGHRREEQI